MILPTLSLVVRNALVWPVVSEHAQVSFNGITITLRTGGFQWLNPTARVSLARQITTGVSLLSV